MSKHSQKRNTEGGPAPITDLEAYARRKRRLDALADRIKSLPEDRRASLAEHLEEEAP